MLLCNECAAKVKLTFPRRRLVDTIADMRSDTCGTCRKRRFCREYDLVVRIEWAKEEMV